MELVMAPADSSAGDSDLPWLLALSWRSKSESMASSLAFCSWALRPWAGKEGEMEFGGVGRSRDRVTVIAGSLRAATAVKLSRLKEAWGISRAAVAKEAMFSFIPELQEMLRSSKSAARDAALVSISTLALGNSWRMQTKRDPRKRNSKHNKVKWEKHAQARSKQASKQEAVINSQP
jgi:hypothetical protein